MKKSILIFAAILFSFGSFAQTDSTKRMNHGMDDSKKGHDMNKQSMDKSHPDGIMMTNGKMMMVKDGKMTMLDHDMTMSNGTKVMVDGSYMKKDGTKMMMKEGQHMDMSGKMMKMKDSKMNN